jgi:hypothetical protein
MKNFFWVCLWLVSYDVKAGEEIKKFDKPSFNISLIAGSRGSIEIPSMTPGKKSDGKSKKKAFFYSLLIPGMGELYQSDWKFNQWGSGLYYFAAEAVFWSGHFYLKSVSGWLKEDARALAARKAGVDLNSPKPKDFYFNIGKFSNVYAYNDYQRRYVGTATLYDETDANFWQWSSEKSRKKYDRMRIDRDNYRNYSQYILWGVFVNHVMSAVNSMRVFRKNRSLSGFELHLDMFPGAYGTGISEVKAGVNVKF